MKLSEMTMPHLAEWVHVQEDDARLPDAWEAAKKWILTTQGIDETDADLYDDLTVAAIIYTADILFNTTMSVASDKVNRVIESFIGAHDHNLLPRGGV